MLEQFQQAAKKRGDETEDLRCPLSLLIFLDPVIASDGHTYEREQIQAVIDTTAISPKTREVLTQILTPNHDKRGAVLKYLQNHPELYEQDEVYLSKKLKAELIDAIKSGNVKTVVTTLQKDPRLITVSLNKENQNCLELSCKQPSIEILREVLKYLPEKDQMVLREPSRYTITLLSLIALNMGSVGLSVWCEAFKFEPESFFPALGFFAVEHNSINLLEAVLEKIDINTLRVSEQQSLLHCAAAAAVKSMIEAGIDEVPEKNIAIIRLLCRKKIDGKLKDINGMTAADLAKGMGCSLLAEKIEIERRRAKLMPLLLPLQESQARLMSEVSMLSSENAALRRTLESAQQELQSLTMAFKSAEIQKIEKAFIPHVCKSYSVQGEISQLLAIGKNHLVTVSNAPRRPGPTYDAKQVISVWDLSQPATSSCIKIIPFPTNENHSRAHQTIFPLDDTRFIFVENSIYPAKTSAKFVIWNIIKNTEEKSFTCEHYSGVRILKVIDDNTVLFCCLKNQPHYDFNAAQLDIRTKKITPDKHFHVNKLEMIRFISHPAQSEIVYMDENNRERSDNAGGMYSYNCTTGQTTRLLPQKDLHGCDNYSSFFKFITPDLLGLEYYTEFGDVKSSLRLFNIRTQQFVHTFSDPSVRNFNLLRNDSQRMQGACMVSNGLLATVVAVKENLQITLWDLEKGISRQQFEIAGLLTGGMLYDSHRDLLYLAGNGNITAVQLNPDLTSVHELRPQRSRKK